VLKQPRRTKKRRAAKMCCIILKLSCTMESKQVT
jgi:hypothetical protein